MFAYGYRGQVTNPIGPPKTGSRKAGQQGVVSLHVPYTVQVVFVLPIA